MGLEQNVDRRQQAVDDPNRPQPGLNNPRDLTDNEAASLRSSFTNTRRQDALTHAEEGGDSLSAFSLAGTAEETGTGLSEPVEFGKSILDAGRRLLGGTVRSSVRGINSLQRSNATLATPLGGVLKYNQAMIGLFSDAEDPESFAAWHAGIFQPDETELAAREGAVDLLFGEEGQAQYAISGIAEEIGEFIPAFAAMTVATGGAGAVPLIASRLGVSSTLGKIGIEVGVEGLRGAVADLITWEAHEARLSDAIERAEGMPEVARSMAGVLASDTDDSFWVGKMKQATEGFITGAVFDTIVAGMRATRSKQILDNLRKSGQPVARQEGQAQQVVDHLEEARIAHQSNERIVEVPEGGFEARIRPRPEKSEFLGEVVREDVTSPVGVTGTDALPTLRESITVPFNVRGNQGTYTGFINPEDPTVLRNAGMEIDNPGSLSRSDIVALEDDLRAALGVEEMEFFRVGSRFQKATLEAAEKGIDPPELKLQRRPLKRRNPVLETAAEADSVLARADFVDSRRALPADRLTGDQIAQIDGLMTKLSAAPVRQWPELLRNNGIININYTRSAKDARALIQALVDRAPTKFVSKKVQNAKPLRRITRLAHQMFDGMSADEVVEAMRHNTQTTANLDQMVIGNAIYFNALGSDIAQLSRLVARFPEDTVMLEELGKAMDHAFDVAGEMVGQSANIGRGLQAHQRAALVFETLSEFDRKFAPRRGGSKSFAGLSKEEMLSYARRIEMSEGNMRHIMREARLLHEDVLMQNGFSPEDPKFWDKIQELRVSGMVSAPKTIEANVISGLIKLNKEPLTMLMAGFRTGNRAQRQEAFDMFIGNFLSVRDGFRAFRKKWVAGEGNMFQQIASAPSRALDAAGGLGQAIRTGKPVLDPLGQVRGLRLDAIGVGNIDEASRFAGARRAVRRVTEPFGRFVRQSRKPLVAGDEIIKRIASYSKVRARSLRNARANPRLQALRKSDPDKWSVEVSRQIEDDLEFMVDRQGRLIDMDALDYARDVTFTQALDPATLGGFVQKGLQQFPFGKMIQPFHRIGVHLFRESWALTPVVGRFAPQMREALEAGGERAAAAKANMMLGNMAYAAGTMMAMGGMLTGSGPKSDNRLRKQWRDAGNKPYHLKVGDKQYDLRRVWPFSAPLMMAADITEVIDYMSETEVKQAAMVVVSGFASAVTSPTFMRSVTEFIEASTGDRFALDRFFDSFAGSLIPYSSLLRAANPDDVMRETQGTIDNLLSQLPIVSGLLEPDRNALGEQVMRPPGYLNRLLNPFTPAPKADPLLNELVEMGVAMPMPSPTLLGGEIDLRDRDLWRGEGRTKSSRPDKQSPFDRMMELMGTTQIRGRTTRQAIVDMMKTRRWQEASGDTDVMPGGLRYRMIANLLESRYDTALGIVKREYPELVGQIALVNRMRGAALREGQTGVDRVKAWHDHLYKR